MSKDLQSFVPPDYMHLKKLGVGKYAFAGYCTYLRKSTEEFTFPITTINYVLKGEKIVFLGSENYYLKAGDFIVIKRGTKVYTEVLWKENGYESINVILDSGLLNDFFAQNTHLLLDNPSLGTYPELFTIKGNILLNSYFHSLIPYFNFKRLPLDHIAKVKFYELLHILIETDETYNFLNLLKESINEKKITFEDILSKHITSPLSLLQLADHTGMSLSAFKREFNHNYGMPPKQWINEKRLQMAHFLLNTTGKTVTDVSFEVGFESVSYFIQSFKELYGYTPKQITKNLKLI